MNKHMKVFSACLLATAFGVGLVSTTASLAEAGAVKHRIHSTSPTMKNDISYLKNHTTFSDDEIAELLSKNFKKDDIQNIYVLRDFVNKEDRPLDKMIRLYQEAGERVEVILASEGIDKDKYDDAFNKVFPEDQDTDFERVKAIKNLRYKEF